MLGEFLLFLAAVAAPTSSINFPIPLEYQGNTDAFIRFVNPENMEFFCGKAEPGKTIIACVDKYGIMILPNPCLLEESKVIGSYAHVMCHEKAHVNGWRHK